MVDSGPKFVQTQNKTVGLAFLFVVVIFLFNLKRVARCYFLVNPCFTRNDVHAHGTQSDNLCLQATVGGSLSEPAS